MIDASGQKLFAGPDGLYRWDGRRFHRLRSEPSSIAFEPATRVLYVSGRGGTFRYPNGRWGQDEPKEKVFPALGRWLLPTPDGSIFQIIGAEPPRAVIGGQRFRLRPSFLPITGEIRSLFRDRKGWVWVGTTAGLTALAQGAHAFSTASPLFSERHIFGIAEDRFGHFWIGTRSGLLAVSAEECRLYMEGKGSHPPEVLAGREQGLRGINLGTAETSPFAVDQRGVIWMASLRGLIEVDPLRFHGPKYPSHAVVSSVMTEPATANLMSTGKSIELPNNRFLARILALNPTYPEMVEGEYRLEPSETGWTRFRGETIVTYRALPHGSHWLNVRPVVSLSGGTPTPTRVAIEVLLRWWERSSVRVIFGVALLGLCAAAVRFRERHLRQQQLLLESQITQRTKQLAAAKERAEQASEAKSRFLLMMSHEIRTPLAGMVGAAELIDTNSSSENDEWLPILRSSAKSLLALLNGVLDYSQIESGRLEIQTSRFNVKALVHEAAALFVPAARQRGLRLDVLWDPDTPTYVEGDRVRIRQVLICLIGNALKFTNSGWIQVRVHRQDSEYRFTVQDTGIGIAAEHIPTLFHEFSQIDSRHGRRYGGAGLGLAISQSLANLMRGRIDVSSTVDVGSTFTLRLPLKLVRTAIQPSESESGAEDSSMPKASVPVRGTRVLVVDDNLVNLRIAARQLEMQGCEADTASTALIATRFVEQQTYQLILMDCQMPEVDGFELTKRLRESGVRTPIVAFTAHSMPEDRENCLRAGMDDFLAKPLRQQDLNACLLRWVADPVSGVPGADPREPV